MTQLHPSVLTLAKLLRSQFGDGVALVQASQLNGRQTWTPRYPTDPPQDSHDTFSYPMTGPTRAKSTEPL